MFLVEGVEGEDREQVITEDYESFSKRKRKSSTCKAS